MKRYLIVLALILFVFSISAQTKSLFTYTEDSVLAPVSRAAYDWFGSPCISGNMMMIGGSISAAVCGAGSGAGYVNYYEKNLDGDWEFVQRIESPEPEDCDHFGSDMAIDGDWAFIGAWWDDNNTYTDVGKVYRFQKVGGTWVHTPPDLYCPNPDNEDMFGVSLEIRDGLAFIGSLKDNTGSGYESGTVYYYTVTAPGTLTPQGYINAPSDMGHDAGDNFGADIGYYDSTLVISAYRDDNGGSAYIFRLEGSSWDCTQKITGSDTEFGDGWGEGIDIDRGVIISGSFLDSTLGMRCVGSAYAFTEDETGTWIEREIFRPANAIAWDYFGSRVSMENGVAAIGAFKRDAGVTDGGAVYFYTVNNTYSINYLAGSSGNISGNAFQTVNHGDNSTAVAAVPDMGYAFIDWSDTRTDNPRIDSNITSDMTVTANFDTVILSIPVTGVRISTAIDTIAVGETISLIADVLPETATNTSVTWSIDNSDIASIDPISGILTGMLPGEVIVTVTTEEGNYTASIEIVVIAVTSFSTFENGQIICYPNPSSGTIIIENKGISENADLLISIYDLRGSCIHKEQLQENRMIIQLQKGIYLVRMSDGFNVSMHKIIIY